MAEDITQEVLRNIQADLVELKTGIARIEAKLVPIDEAIRGLSRITIGLVGAVDDIRDRLARLEQVKA